MAGGLIFGHGLCSVGSSFFLLRPLQPRFGPSCSADTGGPTSAIPFLPFTRTVLACTPLIWAKIRLFKQSVRSDWHHDLPSDNAGLNRCGAWSSVAFPAA